MPAANAEDYIRQILRLEKCLRAYLQRFAPQAADIEDLMQETYSHLFRLNAEQRAAIGNVEGFAMRSARNVAMDWLRHRRVVSMQSIEELAELPVIDDTAKLEEIAHRHQQLTLLIEGIKQLPRRCRQVFTLRRVYGLTQKEIAKRLGIAEGTVEQQLVKATRRCVTLLKEAGYEAQPKPVSWRSRKPGETG